MSSRAMSCDVFDAIADPTRRRLLDLLREGERTAMSLVAAFRVRQPTISRHLRVLREAGLVSVSEKGRYRLYRLNAERLRPAALWLGSYEKFWERKLDALSSYLERNQPVSRSVRHGGKSS